jgi:hypothetical protein
MSLTLRRIPLRGGLAAGILLFYLPVVASEQPSSRIRTAQGDFSLHAEPIAAFEGGPVILRVVYHYEGAANGSIVVWPARDGGVEIDVPPDCSRRESTIVMISGRLVNRWRLDNKKEHTEYYALHQRYKGIDKGDHQITVRWRVILDGRAEALGAPEMRMMIRVRQVNAAAVADLRDTIMAELKRKDAIGLSASLMQCLADANHPDILRLRFELLDDARLSLDARDAIIQGVSNHGIWDGRPATTSEQKNMISAVCAYLMKDRPPHAAEVVRQMTRSEAPAGLAKFLKPNVGRLQPMVAALCYVAFPDLLGDAEERRLLSGLSTLFSAIDKAAFASHIRGLEADSYRERELAAAALQKMGSPAVGALRSELLKPHTPDVRERIEKLTRSLESIDNRQSQPMEAGVLDFLRGAKNRRAAAVIEALAANTGDAFAVREARVIRGKKRP